MISQMILMRKAKYFDKIYLLSLTANRKKLYDYFIAFLGLTDIVFNIFAVFVDNTNLLINYISIPFFCIEIYLSCVTIFYIDIIEVKDIFKIILRYLKWTFWIDIIGTLPLFAIDPSTLLCLKLVRILKFRLYIDNI